MSSPATSQPRSIRSLYPNDNDISITINPNTAGKAMVSGIEYFKKRLCWSGTQIAKTLHLPPNTFNAWLKNEKVPINGSILPPDIQAIIHLLAIHRSLEAMFDESSHQQAWLETFHPELHAVPQELMAESIEKLIFVRQYLDYVRGRGA